MSDKVVRDLHGTTWNNMVPKKVNVFLWRTMIARLLVRMELDKKGIDLDSLLCPCCDNYTETVEHCIISCEDAMRVWEMIFTWWGMGSVNVFTVRDLFSHKGGLVVDKVPHKVWNAVLRFAGYLIWKRRDDRVFRGTCGNIVRLFQDVQLKSYEWINRRSKSIKLEWEKWIRRPQNCGIVQGVAQVQ
ncbi:reverse transcriptase domain, reverse transcriptase zinc-binding domain protein [Tanacetum coccineum]